MDIYGVFWIRFLDWGVRRCPFFIEPLLVAGYTLVFYAVAGRQRRAVAANLAVLCPEASTLGRQARALAVFWEFAWMIVDSARARSGERHVTWRLEGAEAFRQLSEGAGPAVILTAHMGNYDVAGPFFAEKMGRAVHGVRMREKRADTQAYMEAQRRAMTRGSAYHVQYNDPGNFLGVELARALAAGEVVALQGDRAGGGMAETEVAWRGRAWALPSGPMALATISAAPVFPIFVVREGWRSYRIQALPPHASAAKTGGRDGRAAAQRELTLWWAGVLAGMLESHWPRWLMFEPAFRPLEPDTTGNDAANAAGEDAAAAMASSSPASAVRDAPPPITPIPPTETESAARPERTTAHGWRPVLQPISRTALGRFLNSLGFFLPPHHPHTLRAEDSAQNWVEAWTLAAFSGALAGAMAWTLLRAVLPPLGAWLLLGPVWFGLLHLAPMAAGWGTDFLRARAWLPRRWPLSRATEEAHFLGQTLVSAAFVWTGVFRWLGAAWLIFAVANALAALPLRALARRGRGNEMPPPSPDSGG